MWKDSRAPDDNDKIAGHPNRIFVGANRRDNKVPRQDVTSG